MPSDLILRSFEAPFIQIVIEPPLAILGRDSNCDIVLDHPTISRRHVEICAGRDCLAVTDLDSRNGTFLDGRPICHNRAAQGQTLRFGALSFLVDCRIPSDEEETDGTSASAACPFAAQAENLLSDAQNRVFRLLLAGIAEKAIARKLDLSRATVHNHTTAIYRALNVHSRSELFTLILRSSAQTQSPQK